MSYTYKCVQRHQFILPNRHIEGLSALNNRTSAPNAYIFGSSVSQAFTTNDWSKHLPDTASPFHFDGLGEGLKTIRNKINYINSKQQPDHILLIVSSNLLAITSSQNEPFKIEPPLISGESKYDYWIKLIRHSLDPRFMMAFIHFSITRDFEPYMRTRLMNWGDEPHFVDCYTNDEWNPEAGIGRDSTAYFQERLTQGIIPEDIKLDICYGLNSESINLLYEIDSLVDPKCSIDIIIPPSRRGKVMSQEAIDQLQKAIPSAKILNASAHQTNPGYFYDAVHIRPLLARHLLREHYQKP